VEKDGTIHLGPRSIPLPASVSDEARAVLSMPLVPRPEYPPVGDKPAWRKLIAEYNASFDPFVDIGLSLAEGRSTVETAVVAGVTVHVGTPTTFAEGARDRAVMTLHGGAFIVLGGAWARAEGALVAAEWGAVAYSVDYRMPPDTPYPAAVDDVVAVYRALLERYEPWNIIVWGVSAGGNLALAGILRARDVGLPLPAAVIANSPECDLTESGDTFHTLRHLDPRLPTPLPESIALYADGHDLTDPYLSPVFADFGAGFAPTYIQSGTRDLFLSNCVRLHRAMRKGGVDAELHIWEAGLHGGFLRTGAPEADEERAEQDRFLAKHWGARGDR
jgi:acetyl esterase/lipase